LPSSISLGVSTKNEHTKSTDMIIKKAEDKMYKHKLTERQYIHILIISSLKKNLVKKDEIQLTSRIISIVDAYDAMTNDRPYRKSISKRQAINELKRNSGLQFDPLIVKKFISILGKKGASE
jgi:hypothetical protein